MEDVVDIFKGGLSYWLLLAVNLASVPKLIRLVQKTMPEPSQSAYGQPSKDAVFFGYPSTLLLGKPVFCKKTAVRIPEVTDY